MQAAEGWRVARLKCQNAFGRTSCVMKQKCFIRTWVPAQLCRNASLVCTTVARQSLLTILTTVLQSAKTWAKHNPSHPFKKYGSHTWVWKGTIQVSSFSDKVDLSWVEIICSLWFLSFHMTEGSWFPAALTSMAIQTQDTTFYLFFNVTTGLLAEIWVWLERGKHHFKTWEEIGWALAKAGPASWNWGTPAQYHQK